MPREEPRPQLHRFFEFELDERRFELRGAGEPVPIARQVFDLLAYLLKHRNRLVTKDELLETIWKDRVVGDESVSRCVSTARRLVGDSASTQHTIKTVHGRGYWFVAPVAEGGDPGAIHPPDSLRSRVPFVGRAGEMSALQEVCGAAGEGVGACALVTGDAGIGKTRLLEELASALRTRGFRVLFGRCFEDEGAPPAWPWTEVARDVQLALSEQVGDDEASAIVADLGNLLPGVGRATQPAPAEAASTESAATEAARFRAFSSMAGALHRLARDQPILLILDDLHRADVLSVDLLRFIVQRSVDERVMVVAAYRDSARDLGGTRKKAIAGIQASPRVLRLQLDSLPASAVLDALLDSSELPEALAPTLHDRSGGNPFLLTLLFQLLLPRSGDPIARLSQQLPRSTRAAVLTLVDSLPAKTQECLEAAAVVGRCFDVAGLKSILGAPHGKILELLEPALQAGIIEESGAAGAYRFRHVLVADALYGENSLPQKVRRHRVFARELSRRHGRFGAHLAQRAHHLTHATPLVGAGVAVQCELSAARWASDRFAFEQARDHLQRALALCEHHGVGDADRFEVLLALGSALLSSGERERARIVLRRAAGLAARLGGADRLSRVALRLAPGFFAIETGVVDQFLVEALERAISAQEDTEGSTFLRLIVQLALALYWSGEGIRRNTLVVRAEALAERLGDPASRSFAMMARFAALWSPDTHAERRFGSGRLVDAADEGGEPSHALMARVFLITTLLGEGDVDAVDREVCTLEELAETLGDQHVRWYPVMFRAMRATMRGEFAKARRLSSEFLRMGMAHGDVNAVQSFALIGAQIRWETGQLGNVVDSVEQLASRYRALPGWRSVSCILHLELGHVPKASAIFDELAEGGFARLGRDTTWLGAIAVLTRVCVSLGDERRAAELYDLLLPFEHDHVVVGFGTLYWGSVALRLGTLAGLLGDGGAADRHLGQAIDTSAAAGSWPWLARSQVARARWVPGASHPGATREGPAELLRPAHQSAKRIGMAPLCREIEALTDSGAAGVRS